MRNGSGTTLMSAQEVATVFAVPRSTVSRWAKAGKLPSFKTPGGRYRFERAEVEKLLPEMLREAS